MAHDYAISEREFWRLTPALFQERVQWVLRRETREWERTAQLAHWIMSAWQKAPSRDELLGRVMNA